MTGVTKRFESYVALNAIDLSIARGELMTLLGPSGCGKTPLLRTLAGFLRHDAGHIEVAGRRIDDTPPNKRNFGMVFQNYAIFPHLSVRENVAYGLKARGIGGADMDRRIGQALERVQLSALADRFPDAMSGGQKQRVGLARAMVIEPDVLLMDEPLSNLDAKLRIEMRQQIRLMQRELGITTLYVTHDQEEAMAISDRVAVMERGVLRQLATPEAIYTSPANAFVADFIGGCNWFEGTLEASAGEARVRLANGAVFVTRLAANTNTNTNTRALAVRVALRTEDFALLPPGSVQDAAFDARHLMTSYLGQRTRWHLRDGTGLALDADLPSRGLAPLVDGVARLGFDPEDARVFAADDGRRLA